MQHSKLRLTLTEYDPAPTPQFNEHLHWNASVESSGFAGDTEFVTSGRELQALLQQLATLDSTLLVQTEWGSGDSKEERFRILVRPNGRTGRLLVVVTLTAPVRETGHARHVTGVFGIMPNTLRQFVLSLRRVLAAPVEGTQIVLIGDREADV